MSTESDVNKKLYWLVWIVISASLLVGLGYTMLRGEDKTVFMPGPLTDGHHQLAQRCEVCHTDPYGSGAVLQEACIQCHGEDRVKPMDTHPRAKFTDPRNADRLAKINATQCVSCHVEHRPAMTGANGLTQPVDVCFHCHAEIGTERISHVGMEFNTCKNAGCHNYHNNRALYTDFLIKHLDEPDVLSTARLPQRELGEVLEEMLDYPHERYPVKLLSASDIDASAAQSNKQVEEDWLATAHAQVGVNCSACHLATVNASEESRWLERPDHQACAQCHGLELARFKRGKHGMRLGVELPALQVKQARLPMRAEANHATLNCTSCHPAHRFDTQDAAVEGCLGCHNDEHSKNYKQSKHYTLWRKELSGEIAAGQGVSCASCHMPRINFDVNDWLSRIMVEHNQNATLSPNSKMVRPACLHCHGLAFSLNALAEQKLVESNFSGLPSSEVDSLSMAAQDQQRALEELSVKDSGLE